jgi:hypothetical protein
MISSSKVLKATLRGENYLLLSGKNREEVANFHRREEATQFLKFYWSTYILDLANEKLGFLLLVPGLELPRLHLLEVVALLAFLGAHQLQLRLLLQGQPIAVSVCAHTCVHPRKSAKRMSCDVIKTGDQARCQSES